MLTPAMAAKMLKRPWRRAAAALLQQYVAWVDRCLRRTLAHARRRDTDSSS
jgi:hypothetical protein